MCAEVHTVFWHKEQEASVLWSAIVLNYSEMEEFRMWHLNKMIKEKMASLKETSKKNRFS